MAGKMSKAAQRYKALYEAEIVKTSKLRDDVRDLKAESASSTSQLITAQTKVKEFDKLKGDLDKLGFRTVFIKVFNDKGRVIGESTTSLDKGDYMRSEITSDGYLQSRVEPDNPSVVG